MRGEGLETMMGKTEGRGAKKGGRGSETRRASKEDGTERGEELRNKRRDYRGGGERG